MSGSIKKYLGALQMRGTEGKDGDGLKLEIEKYILFSSKKWFWHSLTPIDGFLCGFFFLGGGA